MTKPLEASVFEVAAKVVPRFDIIAGAIGTRQETAERLYRLALLDYAAAMTASEVANQAVTDKGDFTKALADLVNSGKVDMKLLDAFSADVADAYSVIANILTYACHHAPSMLAILLKAQMPVVTEAAKELSLVERMEWVNAILAAGDSES